MKHYVIVGCGTAAIGCVEGIRSVDKQGRITIVSAENHPAYCRPLISYYLEDKTTEEKMKYRDDSFYEENKCDILFGATATKIDIGSKTVLTDKKEEIPFDALCMATGSSPFVPPMQNIEKVEKKFSFLTLDDAKKLKEAVKPGCRVLIVGAGLIGLKCAEGLRAATENITVCDLSDHILSSILDTEDALVVQKHLEENGICFSLHNSVKCFENNNAIMNNGEQIPFDILVTAVGVRPNIGAFQDAGGVCDRGITVNERMETSIADIYAAGDCTESRDITDGKVKIMALMPNAYLQGFTAGVNMAGGEMAFDNAIPMNSIGFFGYHLMTAGPRCGKEIVTKDQESVKRLYFDGNRLVGFVLLGEVKNAGIYTNFIRNRLPVDNSVMESMIKNPNLSLYDPETRRNSLERVV